MTPSREAAYCNVLQPCKQGMWFPSKQFGLETNTTFNKFLTSFFRVVSEIVVFLIGGADNLKAVWG